MKRSSNIKDARGLGQEQSHGQVWGARHCLQEVGGAEVDQVQGVEVLGQEHEVASHLRASIFALKLEKRSLH